MKPTDSMTGILSRRRQALVNEHPADFHAAKLDQAGQVERYAGVLEPRDFNDRAAVAVFEDNSEGLPITSTWRPGGRTALYLAAFVPFHHRDLTLQSGRDPLRRILPGIAHER
jgi:hypothetical protein